MFENASYVHEVSPVGWHLRWGGGGHNLCPTSKTDRNLNESSEMQSESGYFLYSILNRVLAEEAPPTPG